MLFKIQNDTLIIKNTENNEVEEISLNGFNYITNIAFNTVNNLLAIDGSKNGVFALYIYDKNNSKCLNAFPGSFNDLCWFTNDIIFYNSGKSICSIDITKNIKKDFFKFSRVDLAPIDISINNNKSKLSYLKGVNQEISVFDIENCENKIFKNSCSNYSWYETNSILFSLGDDIKKLNIDSEKTEIFIKDIKSILKTCDNLNYKRQIEDILKIVNSDSLIFNEIRNPKYINNRIYFEIFACDKNNKIIGVFSINNNKTDFKIHFMDNIGLIRDYYILNNENIIGIKIEANTLLNEKIESGLKYYQNNELVDFKGFIPLNKSILPTKDIYIWTAPPKLYKIC